MHGPQLPSACAAVCYHVRMFVLFRSFIVWCMLLALPYQGYAAAAMMICAPAMPPAQHAPAFVQGAHACADSPSPAAAADTGRIDQTGHRGSVTPAHGHNAMHDQHDGHGSHDEHGGHAHGSTKCGGAACCIASAPVLAGLPVVPALPAVSGPVPFYAGFIAAVHLAHPDRPPQPQQA